DTPKPTTIKKEPSTVTITYTVKQGDGLLLLADIFDCRVSDIKKWNGMRKDAIFKGQKLKIKVPKSKVAYYKKINTMTMAQKRKLAKKR
ncbi:MAG: LysM peptidoglycan-binding domain-containing protein, partial [Bacteroidetes bacterium]|nr:LysM peptidoglycan-binding domain-containing protein [Bacteroidota bacterium]